MAFDEQPLSRSGPPPGPPAQSSSSPTRWIVVGALAIVAGGLLALWWMTRARLERPAPAPTAATDVAVQSNRPARQPMELPTLAGSDALLRDLVSTLSKHPTLARLLATSDLVRRAVLAVEQIGDGRTPAAPLTVLRPSSRLQIAGGDAGAIDPVSYGRWDSATAALTSINPRDAAALYVNLKSLFDDAYRELGHPGGDFDESIVRALGVLNATPLPAGEPELLRRPGYFEHSDPKLRNLRPVQKQLLLIGPANRARVLAWLAQLADALDLKRGD